MERYAGSEINAWPSFADLMLSVVLVLVTILVAAVVFITTGPDYSAVEASQRAIRAAIETKSDQQFTNEESRTYSMSYPMLDRTTSTIKVVDEALLQRFTFGAGVLFESDEDTLNARGADLITQIGESIVEELGRIREVQVHGHTDTLYELRPGETVEDGQQYNLDLASRRAANVFRELREAGVDPITNLMSIASYGPFRTVNRIDDEPYDEDQLDADNRTNDMRAQNRRIELLLHFHDPNVVTR